MKNLEIPVRKLQVIPQVLCGPLCSLATKPHTSASQPFLSKIYWQNFYKFHLDVGHPGHGLPVNMFCCLASSRSQAKAKTWFGPKHNTKIGKHQLPPTTQTFYLVWGKIGSWKSVCHLSISIEKYFNKSTSSQETHCKVLIMHTFTVCSLLEYFLTIFYSYSHS